MEKKCKSFSALKFIFLQWPHQRETFSPKNIFLSPSQFAPKIISNVLKLDQIWPFFKMTNIPRFARILNFLPLKCSLAPSLPLKKFDAGAATAYL